MPPPTRRHRFRYLRRDIVWLLLLTTSLSAKDSTQAPASKPFAVPYRLTPAQHILVRAKINGRGPFNLIVDTGAPILIMSRKVATAADAKLDANGWATLDRFELEGGVVLSEGGAGEL